jgi:hypothetical protein
LAEFVMVVSPQKLCAVLAQSKKIHATTANQRVAIAKGYDSDSISA